MWELTCEGDLLDGKTIWLRPGSQHLLGRTTSNASSDHVRYIDHKSISRKHLLITVDPVKPGDSTKVQTRSTVTLTDSSKSGTFVNGERLEKSQKVVDKTDNEIRLGASDYIFHIRWRPVVLSFTNLTKTQKSRADSLQEFRAALEPADVKLVATYLSDSTTHVVANGRNNPSCLQALAQAKWTVQYAWVEALKKAVKLDGSGLSALETDFDGSWPSEERLIVPCGSEPVHQPDALLHPDAERAEVFKGLTFIFMSSQSFDTLLPVVVAGGGKAFLQEVTATQTTAAQFVQGIKDHIRESKAFKSGTELDFSKTVVVRPSDPKANVEWWDSFHTAVERRVHKKSILQSAFLNFILTMDLSAMHEAVDHDMIDDTEGTQTRSSPIQLPSQSPVVDDQTSSSKPEDSAPADHSIDFWTRKPGTQSRFKLFDDFDPSQITYPAEIEESNAAVSQANGHAPEVSETQPSKKRTRDIGDVVDAHLSGVAAMKKRRLDETPQAEGQETATSKVVDPFTRKPKDRLVDVKAKLLEQRKKEAAERERNEKSLTTELDNLTVEEIKKFVQHEEFEVIVPEHSRGTLADRQASAGWNPAWNGRRNFKAFRPQGERREEPRQQRVMVSLEPAPVKRAAFLEDEYYLTTQRDTSSNGINEAPDPPTGRSQQQSNSNGRLSYVTNEERSQTLSPVRIREKRPLEEMTGGRQSKRPRNRVTINLDEDDDELQFRRKRL